MAAFLKVKESTVTQNYEKTFLNPKIDSRSKICNSPSSGINSKSTEKGINKYENSNPIKSNNNNSTLSLHISAYENSVVETFSAATDSSNEKPAKKWKNVKQNFVGEITTTKSASAAIQNSYEFPRQQSNAKNSDPEIMQFKTSQRLFNPVALNNSRQSNARGIHVMDHHRFPPSNGGRPQHQQQSQQQQQQQSSTLSRRTLGLRTTGTLHSQPKAIPALLKSSKADFGEDYVDSQRRNRFGRNGGARARSEIAEVLSNGGNSRLNTSYFQHRRETSYNDDDRHSLKAVRSTSYYDRPRSSFEPAMNHSSSTAAPRIIRNRQDDWQEVERRHQNQYSSDEDFDDEELESAESDQLREELEMYNTRRGGNHNGYGAGGGGGARMSSSYHYSSSSRQQQPRQEFSENDICFFGMLKLTPQKARQFITMKEPPPEFWSLTSVEKAAYLYYFSLYKQYIVPVEKFHKIFNREFFKYTADGDSDDVALMKICKHTYDEYDLRRQRINKQAYDRSRQHLFSDDRATPDSRATSYCEQLDESDITSVDSGAKEPHRFTKPHAFASFAVGGKLLILNPEFSISTVQLIDVKRKIRDRGNVRNIDAMEHFKGPLIIGETPSHTPLLFIERQINNIRNSEIYRQNPLSSDANDVLLIWRLLEMLIRQHGNVTGPDLARLLTENYSFSSPPKPVRGRADKEYLQPPSNGGGIGHGTDSPMFAAKDERRVDQRAMDRFTQFLLGGYIDEAIESATSDGLFFDALILAYRMFGNDRRKMEQIESKLLSYRDPQHPSLTLLSVASQMPVPILSNMSATDNTSAWRAHIAIVLANLNNDTAMYTVHQLGLALSRKEFNAAADFCFLAVNLLTQHDCFAPVDPSQQSDDEEPFRRHITLINASLPDDEYYSTKTRYGWSIVDFQATEIYDFALKMSQRPIAGGLTASAEYQKCRLEYAQMLAEYGGAATSAFKYCTSIVGCIWNNSYLQSASMLNDLCDLADRLHCAANQTTEELQWVPELRKVAAQIISNELTNTAKSADSGLLTAIQNQSIPDSNFIIAPTSGAGFRTSTPIQPLDGFVPHMPNMPPQPPSFYNPTMAQQTNHNQLGIPVSEAIDIGATPAPTPHKTDNDDESILPLHQPHSSSHYHHQQQQSPELRKHSLVDTLLHNNLIHSSKDALGFGSSTTIGKEDEESILPVHQLPRQGSIEQNSLPSQSPPPHSPPLQIQSQQQHQSSPFSEPQLSPSFYPTQHFSYQQPPPPQQQQQQQQQRQRTESQQFSDPVHSQQQQFQPHANPPVIPSQDFSAFSQPSIKPEPSSPQPQQPYVEQQQQPQPMQQQHQQQQSQPQKQQQQPEKKQEKSSGGGLFGGLAKKIVKYIPSGNEMKLPDDSKSNITWDEKLGRWVGEGIEEPAEVPPPPMMMSSANAAGSAAVTPQSSSYSQAPSQPQAPGGMAPAPAARPHRKPATSRYASAKTIENVASPVAPAGMPSFQMPTASAMPPSFGFMPTVPDNTETNGEEAANPFSYHPDTTNSQ